MSTAGVSGVAAAFSAQLGAAPVGVWAAPGRVNVIGEHTDYSDGFVLPMALPQVCRVAAGSRDDGLVRVGSAQQPGGDWQTYPVTAGPGEVTGWSAYVLGVVWAIRSRGYDVPGLDLLLDSEVPLGSGLSSSAAVGCGVALALRDLFDLPLTVLELAALTRHSENAFVGAPTGAMDQAISLLGRPGHLLFLDTRDMRHEHVPFDLDAAGLSLLVVDSRTRHALTDGGYAAVREAVEQGARGLGVSALRDVPSAGLAARCAGLEPPVAARVRHVVTENDRVLEVVRLLRDGGDPSRIGPVLLAGHASLRDDFGVSTAELDTTVEAAVGAGAVGARMTGGGFGGCAIALVATPSLPAVQRAIESAYSEAGFSQPGFLVARPSAGARRLAEARPIDDAHAERSPADRRLS